MTNALDQIRELEQQINTWRTRAEMAMKQGSKDLVRSALKERLRYRKRLNVLREQMDEPPFFMSRVPLRYPPDRGLGEIALPLPEPEE